MTVRTVFTLATGNTFVHFVQSVFADDTAAAIFLGVVRVLSTHRRPDRPDFYPLDAGVAARPRVKSVCSGASPCCGVESSSARGPRPWCCCCPNPRGTLWSSRAGAIIALTVLAAGASIAMSVVVGCQEGLLRTRRPVGNASNRSDPAEAVPAPGGVASVGCRSIRPQLPRWRPAWSRSVPRISRR